jgi:hypothetical protein
VRLARRRVNLSAGVEDRLGGELVRVANASMAIRLAALMNDESEGRALPDRGAQHVPIRFQLAHDPAGPSPGASVLFVHGLGVRVVAYAPSDESARRVARLLAHVDYPIDERSGRDALISIPKAHDFGDMLNDLPLPSSASVGSRAAKGYRRRVLGVALWSWLPMIGIAALAIHVVGFVPVLVFAGLVAATLFLSTRALRQ